MTLKGRHHTEKAKQKISLGGTGHIVTEKTRKKISLARTGWVVTEGTKNKISKSMLGGKNHFYGKHHTDKTKQFLRAKALKQFENGIPEKTRQKISLALMGHITTEETRQKISLSEMGKEVTEETRQKIRLEHMGHPGYWKGKHLQKETRQKISFAKIDWDFYNEHGCLKSNYPYNDCFTEEFKDMIRERDGNKCVVTGMTNEEHKKKYGKSLCVHHWIYDKDVTDPFYFVTVTCGINIAAETNRGEWIDMFNGIMEDKYCEGIDNWI